jgi:SAM-dependent methyltransferase
LLELGAGGGHMLSHLSRSFECTAVDASSAMLESCKALVPDVRVIRADMRNCRLDELFDLVLILDAIDYMSTKADARAALATAAAHLAPGGVLLIAPTYTRETFVNGETASDTLPSQGLAYVSHVHDADPRDARYELILVYLIRRPHDRQVEIVEDRHVCGLFSRAEWLQLLRLAGFAPQVMGDDRAWSLLGGTLRKAKPARPSRGTRARAP